MRKLKFSLLCLVAVVSSFFGVNSAFAQQNVSPEKQTLIREFLEASGTQKNAVKTVDLVISFQEREMPKTVSAMIDADKTMTPVQKQTLKQETVKNAEQMGVRFREFFIKQINLGEMLEEISLPIYDKYFTAGELRDLIAFYRTPTGQKLIEVSPKMGMDSMMAFSEKVAPKMQEFLKRTAEAELAQLKQKLPEKAAGKRVRKS